MGSGTGPNPMIEGTATVETSSGSPPRAAAGAHRALAQVVERFLGNVDVCGLTLTVEIIWPLEQQIAAADLPPVSSPSSR